MTNSAFSQLTVVVRKMDSQRIFRETSAEINHKSVVYSADIYIATV